MDQFTQCLEECEMLLSGVGLAGGKNAKTNQLVVGGSVLDIRKRKVDRKLIIKINNNNNNKKIIMIS